MMRIFELNKNLFKVGDNHVCVSDEEIKTYCECVNLAHRVIVKPTDLEWANSNSSNLKKIIFSTQFIHESIPLLNLESEEDKVFKMASENILTSSGFVNTENEMDVAYSFFHNGYQKAKETFKYTEEDLIKARDYGQRHGEILWNEFKHSLQQPKEIKSIEVEYMWFDQLGYSTQEFKHAWRNNLECIHITLPNGKIKCKINY